jgi:hypothetical protein
MKIKNLFFLFFFFTQAIFSQEIIYRPDTVISGIPKSYELSEAQLKAWNKVEAGWEKEYPRILKEQKLKLNCNGCSSIYLDVILSIDENGKLKYYKLLDSDKCSEKFSKGLEIRFMKWFFDYKFPKELFNLEFEVRLGSSLKC